MLIKKLTVIRKQETVGNQKKKLSPPSSLLTTSQSGFSKIIILPILVTAIALSVFLIQQRTNILPFAQERVDTGSCRDNPDVAKRAVDELNNAQTGNQNFYYKWISFCSTSCSQNSDCPQNNDDPDRINPRDSNWCYGFGDGTNKCLKLISVDKATNQPAQTSTGRNPATGSTSGSGSGSNSNSNTTNNTTSNTTRNTSANKTASGSATTTSDKKDNTPLTEAEITGFKASYDAFYAVLGSSKDSGNLKTVSTIAKEELDSIVSEISECTGETTSLTITGEEDKKNKKEKEKAKEEKDKKKDDKKDDKKVEEVGKCLDKNFGKRFDYAKTAARLAAFYAIFNKIGGVCVKSDFGLDPLISVNNGRVVLCSDNSGSTKLWKTFASGQFSPLTDTKFPANPTCATLPSDVLTHYRNAEKLVTGQEGFIGGTQCDGKTTQ